MARKVFDEMPQRGISPDVVTFNVLIRGCCLNSMIDDGFWLCRVGRVETTHNLVKGMQRKGVDLSPNVVTWTTLLRGYCEKQWIDEALEVFEEIAYRGLLCSAIVSAAPPSPLSPPSFSAKPSPLSPPSFSAPPSHLLCSASIVSGLARVVVHSANRSSPLRSGQLLLWPSSPSPTSHLLRHVCVIGYEVYLLEAMYKDPVAEIQRMRKEMSQSAEEAGDDPHVDETDLYYKVVGVDHKG
ncbi:hypothetical protein Sjap_018186 [Stephania japonica]|uniref:Pentatricopeptide repeat-containing protein n=1 Tax=Stephania japonica TaxID=461633 RepID=A0AAP0NMW3_9MAGN